MLILFDVRMTSYIYFLLNLNLESKIARITKSEYDRVIVLKIVQVPAFLDPKK